MSRVDEFGEIYDDEAVGELAHWASEVKEFGGSSVPVRRAKTQASLGKIREVIVTGGVALSTAPVVLAEMTLSEAIAVDVIFSYPNIEQVIDTALTGNLGQGDGFVRVTWGVPGAAQVSVDCDGGMGWRYPFVASYLRVEYFPADLTVPVANRRPAITNQARNLKIQAMIAPASGAQAPPLIRTRNFPAIGGAGNGSVTVPRWARAVTVCATSFTILAPAWHATIKSFGLTEEILKVGSNLNTSQFPTWSGVMQVPLPQSAREVILTSDNGGHFFTDSSAVFELAI